MSTPPTTSELSIAERVAALNMKLNQELKSDEAGGDRVVRFSVTLQRASFDPNSSRVASTTTSCSSSTNSARQSFVDRESVVSMGLAPVAPLPPEVEGEVDVDVDVDVGVGAEVEAPPSPARAKSNSLCASDFVQTKQQNLSIIEKPEVCTHLSLSLYNDINKYLEQVRTKDSHLNPFSILAEDDDEDDDEDEDEDIRPHDEFMQSVFYQVDDEDYNSSGRKVRVVSNCPAFLEPETRQNRVGSEVIDNTDAEDRTVEQTRKKSLSTMGGNGGLQLVTTHQKFGVPVNNLRRLSKDGEKLVEEDEEEELEEQPNGKNERIRERDLSSTQFYNVYSMTRDEFFQLPMYKRAYLREKKKGMRPRRPLKTT